jgi:hypothetical protein
MEDSVRLKMLKEHYPKNGINTFPKHSDFVEWQAKVAPLLNFNDLYYENWVKLSRAASTPGLSSYTFKPLFSQMDNIILQATAELEYGLTKKPELTAFVLTEEHNVLWFWSHCTWRVRWLIGGVLFAAFALGFTVGRINFFVKVYG